MNSADLLLAPADSRSHRTRPRTAMPYQVIYAIDPHNDTSLCIVRFRERRGSQGGSRAPGWPGQATGGHQLPAGGGQLPDSPGRLRCSPPAHRGRRRDRAAGTRPRHGGRPGHGGRRGARLPGKNVRRAAGGFAADARHRGPFSIPGCACPGCAPHWVPEESFPVCAPTVPVRSPSPSATSSPSRCPPGLARHHRCQ